MARMGGYLKLTFLAIKWHLICTIAVLDSSILGLGFAIVAIPRLSLSPNPKPHLGRGCHYFTDFHQCFCCFSLLGLASHHHGLVQRAFTMAV
jgi:hypothetical protein